MPYEIRKVDKGWKVFTKETNNPHSNKPLPLARAKEQLKALYSNAKDYTGGAKQVISMTPQAFHTEHKHLIGLLKNTGKELISEANDQAKEVKRWNKKLHGGGFDDDDFETLFGGCSMCGGADEGDEEDQKPADDSEAILKLDTQAGFDVEEATGEPEYLKLAKKFAKKAGYKDWNSLVLAHDGKHKLILRGVKFGSIKNNDYIIYKQHFASVAEKKRKQYLARATRIKGDWAKDKYSPNSLAINILWDGSTKKGGDIDWWGLAGDFAKDVIKDAPNMLIDAFGTPEAKEQKRLKEEACKLCNGSGLAGGADKKLNLRKEGDDPRNWGYDSEEEIEAPEEEEKLPEQPQFVGDPTQFKIQPYDPNNPLMYMVGGICKKTGKAPCMCGGRLDPDKVKAQEILEKVAGEGNPKVREIEATPMGDNNIRKYFPNAKILKYSELADIHDISQLLPQPKSFFFLLYEHAPNEGHWTVVNRYIDNGRDTICFFCSYGSKIDGPLYWNSPATNRQLGQDKPYLSLLLKKSGKHLVYNKVQYQSKQSPIATCGAFAVLWIKANIRDNMSIQEFHEWIAEIKKETGLSYDAIASNAISNRAS
jgi:hypothetical protein